MSDISPLAPELLLKARGDQYAADKLLTDKNAPPWVGAFHAQQAVEKSIKAVLARHRVEFPYTHQINVLIDLLRAHQLALPPHADEVDALTPFGAPKRYEPVTFGDAEALDHDAALGWVHDVLQWADHQCR